jgi:hypothetical protein
MVVHLNKSKYPIDYLSRNARKTESIMVFIIFDKNVWFFIAKEEIL